MPDKSTTTVDKIRTAYIVEAECERGDWDVSVTVKNTAGMPVYVYEGESLVATLQNTQTHTVTARTRFVLDRSGLTRNANREVINHPSSYCGPLLVTRKTLTDYGRKNTNTANANWRDTFTD